jgi:hypothetical protein
MKGSEPDGCLDTESRHAEAQAWWAATLQELDAMPKSTVAQAQAYVRARQAKVQERWQRLVGRETPKRRAADVFYGNG